MKSFDFLKDMKVRELSEVEKELKKTKDAHRREKLQRVLKTAVRKLFTIYNFSDFNVYVLADVLTITQPCVLLLRRGEYK